MKGRLGTDILPTSPQAGQQTVFNVEHKAVGWGRTHGRGNASSISLGAAGSAALHEMDSNLVAA